MPTQRGLRLALRISADAKAAGIASASAYIATAIMVNQRSAVLVAYDRKEIGESQILKLADLNSALGLEESIILRTLPAPSRRKNMSDLRTAEADHSCWNECRWQQFLSRPLSMLGIAWTRSQSSLWKMFRQEALQGRRVTFGMLFPNYQNAAAAYSRISAANLILEKSGSLFVLKWGKVGNQRIRWREIALTLEVIDKA